MVGITYIAAFVAFELEGLWKRSRSEKSFLLGKIGRLVRIAKGSRLGSSEQVWIFSRGTSLGCLSSRLGASATCTEASKEIRDGIGGGSKTFESLLSCKDEA